MCIYHTCVLVNAKRGNRECAGSFLQRWLSICVRYLSAYFYILLHVLIIKKTRAIGM